MSIFMTEHELTAIEQAKKDAKYLNLYWGMVNRVKRYSEAPGLSNSLTTTEWWHHATEYLTEAAWVCRVQPDRSVQSWLRSATLELVRRSEDDWVGPFFRDHAKNPPQGHLETAHLSIAVAIVLDLVPEIFTDAEIAEIREKLQNTAIPLCLRWIENNRHLANWRSILLAGATVAAAVLNDGDTLAAMRREYEFCLQGVQPDGSYSESLQYSNYCYFGLMLSYESLIRRQPKLQEELAIPYAQGVKWFVHSFFYNKPLSGWGAYPMPRSANFNDSAAIFGADGDLLAHIAVRAQADLPQEAGLARWMFDQLWGEYPAQGPFDLNSFGMVNRYSFLTMILYPLAAQALSPQELDMPEYAHFSNGQCLARNDWTDGKTILAFSGIKDPLYGPGHQHADLNSLILVHNKERILADPGHTCYRTYVHGNETETRLHNTCTFRLGEQDALQENALKSAVLQQVTSGQRRISASRELAAPVERAGKHLLAARIDDVTVFGADAGAAYANPLEKFERFCIMCGEHALFVVDRITAAQPVLTCWNWLLNNRDGQLEYKLMYPDKIVARRGNAGMKLFHFGDASLSGPVYSHIHDAYHPLPQQLGEGAPGSGLQFTWTDSAPRSSFVRVHGIALDTYGMVARWHLRQDDNGSINIEGPDGCCNWQLSINEDSFAVRETVGTRSYGIRETNGVWRMEK
jgi:hypothetical protein